MLRSGFAGIGLAELLQAAGVPKGSFYNHFDSKEAFGVELVQRYYAQQERLLASLLTQTDRSPLERVRSYFEALLQARSTQPRRRAGACWECSPGDGRQL